jgi:hypothetical protein
MQHKIPGQTISSSPSDMSSTAKAFKVMPQTITASAKESALKNIFNKEQMHTIRAHSNRLNDAKDTPVAIKSSGITTLLETTAISCGIEELYATADALEMVLTLHIRNEKNQEAPYLRSLKSIRNTITTALRNYNHSRDEYNPLQQPIILAVPAVPIFSNPVALKLPTPGNM